MFLCLLLSVGVSQSGLSQTISTGGFSSLAIKLNDRIVGWGLFKDTDIVPQELRDVHSVSAGYTHFLALQKNGIVVAWGNNGQNQLDVPTGLQNVKAISAGAFHSLALKNDGTVVEWGMNEKFDNMSHLSWKVPNNLTDVKAIAAGGNHSLALKNDGSVVMWGVTPNSGVSSAADLEYAEFAYLENKPREIIRGAVAISAGADFSLALLQDGTVRAWGNTDRNQCDVPNGLRNVVDIAAGDQYSLALKKDGTVVAWGNPADGHLKVPGYVKDFVAISAGYKATAIRSNGEVVQWGGNHHHSIYTSQGLTLSNLPKGLKVALPRTDELSFSSEPPILSINRSSINLEDLNKNETLSSNGAIDATDIAQLSFIVSNSGPGAGRNLSADITITGSTSGLKWVSPWPIPNIPAGESIETSYEILTDRNTVDGRVQVKIGVNEPNGFSPKPITVEMETRAFRSPKLEIVDFSSSSKKWKPNTPIELDVLIQNTGAGEALGVQVDLSLPDVVNCYSKNTSIEISSLSSGEVYHIKYDIIVPRSFNLPKVDATITATEMYNDYGTTWNQGFPFEMDDASNGLIAIEASASAEQPAIEKASLNNSTKTSARVSFNEVPKDVIVETVAVVPVDGKDCNGQTVSGQDIASFTEGSLLGLYNVVERRNLERVLDEQRLALSGILYEKSAVEAGCNVGAQGIIFTEYGCLTGQETIQLKLVDCQTSELYWSATGVNATAQETLDKVRQELEDQ